MTNQIDHFKAFERDLRELEQALTGVVAALLQQSNRRAGLIIGVATSKLVAAGIIGGAFGAITAVGVASTGTAIASLSGAAATTATLYWIGSAFGLGVGAGSAMLTGGAVATAIPAAIYAKRKMLGRPRNETDLLPEEKVLLFAALRIAAPVKIALIARTPPTSVEMKIVADTALRQLVSGLRQVYFGQSTSEQEPQTCKIQRRSLAYLPRQRLNRSLEMMDKIATRWMAATRE